MTQLTKTSLLAILLAASACKDRESEDAPKEPVASEEGQGGGEVDPSQPAFEEPVIKVGTKAGRAELTILLKRSEGARQPFRGKVPFTDEPYVLEVKPEERAERISEADVFGTGLALDLDGDGDSEDELDLACEDGVATIAGTRLEPVMELVERVGFFRYTGEEGGGATRLGENGARALLYGPCDGPSVTVGLGPPGEPIRSGEVTSPALQLIVLEEAEGPGGESSVSFEEVARDDTEVEVQSYGGALYEQLPLADEARWYTSRWVMVPLRIGARQQRVQVELTFDGEEERLAVASINEAGADADRIRTRVGGVIIEPLNP